MIKRIISIIFAAVLVFGMGISALSLGNFFVYDYADILTDDEETEFNAKAAELTGEYGCAVYIITVDSLEGMEAWEYNEMLHSELSLGYGEEKSAVILLLSMSERKYDIMAHGCGNTVFTDYGKDVMAERFLDDFADDDWYWGFYDYLLTCDEFLEMAENGEPFDIGTESFGGNFIGVIIAIVISCVIALLVCLILRAQMKTARGATEAHDYAKNLVLKNQYDRFSHRDIRRIYNPPSENSGGGTTINSNGFSHKSGSF